MGEIAESRRFQMTVGKTPFGYEAHRPCTSLFSSFRETHESDSPRGSHCDYGIVGLYWRAIRSAFI